MRGRTFLVLVVVFGVLSLAASIPDVLSYASHDHGGGSYTGQAIAPLTFVDQLGGTQSIESLRGRPFVLAFFCTRCAQAKICDGVSGEIAFLQSHLPKSIRFVELTFDPQRDVLAERSRYAAHYGAIAGRWLVASGVDNDETQTYAATFGVYDEAAAAGRVHTESLILVDADGRVVERASGGASWDSDAFVSDASIAAGASATPAARIALLRHRFENLPPIFREMFFALPAIAYFGWLIVVFARYAAIGEKSVRLGRTL